ncbi:MAG: isoaspartyl peptidase/L-asparaginase [Dehalococcoidia bacterium]|nr:isoaspartyl peptidase/L-asparaginase [Dehalococcoidia bacterium]
MNARIIVHGGAGSWSAHPAALAFALAACEEAARAGASRIAAGASALDAVEAAVRVLEDEPLLNAGRGSCRNLAGDVEMDALIMDGSTLGLGAVAAVRDVCNPVSLARRVMTDTRHTLLAGDGAARFADAIGFPRCDTRAWPTPETRDVAARRPPSDTHGSDEGEATAADADIVGAPARSAPPAARDTVGAVARDAAGNLAVAVSTGGIPKKMPGRVGDSPLVGCGGYADNATAAVAATGDGEALMKLVASKRVCDLVGHRVPVQSACDELVALLHERLDASGGLIALDRHGGAAVAFNTPAMPYAWVDSDGIVRSAATNLRA